MSSDIKTGDTVRLKSGGPLMTVGEVSRPPKSRPPRDVEIGEATCAWFDVLRGCEYTKGEVHAAVFHVDMLVKAAPEPAK